MAAVSAGVLDDSPEIKALIAIVNSRFILRNAKKKKLEAAKRLGILMMEAERYDRAIAWFKRAIELGGLEAQFGLAMCYQLLGNHALFFTWLLESAEFAFKSGFGNGAPQWMLAQEYGKKEQFQDEFIWTKRAADTGIRRAQFHLGTLYAKGQGVVQNVKEAVLWYERAAEKELPAAHLMLAICYVDGVGVEKNIGKAEKHSFSPKVYGNADPSFEVGMEREEFLKLLEIFKKKYEEEAKRLKEEQEKRIAARAKTFAEGEAGNAAAQYIMAGWIEQGDGLKKDIPNAIRWYTLAAKQNYLQAFYKLGCLYFEGREGLPIEKQKALDWVEAGIQLYTKKYGKRETDENVSCVPTESEFNCHASLIELICKIRLPVAERVTAEREEEEKRAAEYRLRPSAFNSRIDAAIEEENELKRMQEDRARLFLQEHAERLREVEQVLSIKTSGNENGEGEKRSAVVIRDFCDSLQAVDVGIVPAPGPGLFDQIAANAKNSARQ